MELSCHLLVEYGIRPNCQHCGVGESTQDQVGYGVHGPRTGSHRARVWNSSELVCGTCKSSISEQMFSAVCLSVAHRLVKNAMEEGGFVLLQNCHLGLKFLVELEEKLMFTDESTVNKDMRIWITSEPTTRFPINLLQMGIKVTNEPPQGMPASVCVLGWYYL